MLAPAGSGAQRTAAVPVPVATMTNGGHHRDWQPVAPGLRESVHTSLRPRLLCTVTVTLPVCAYRGGTTVQLTVTVLLRQATPSQRDVHGLGA